MCQKNSQSHRFRFRVPHSVTPPGGPPHHHHHPGTQPTQTGEPRPYVCVYVWGGGCNHSLVGGDKPQCDDYDPAVRGHRTRVGHLFGREAVHILFKRMWRHFFSQKTNPKTNFLVSGAGDRIKSWGGSFPSRGRTNCYDTSHFFAMHSGHPDADRPTTATIGTPPSRLCVLSAAEISLPPSPTFPDASMRHARRGEEGATTDGKQASHRCNSCYGGWHVRWRCTRASREGGEGGLGILLKRIPAPFFSARCKNKEEIFFRVRCPPKQNFWVRSHTGRTVGPCPRWRCAFQVLHKPEKGNKTVILAPTPAH